MNFKNLLILFLVISSFSACKIDNKEFIEAEETIDTRAFADAIVSNSVDAGRTVYEVAQYAIELIITNALTGTPSVTPRSSCATTTVNGNIVETCHTNICNINGTTYTGCFTCKFEDITDPQSDVDICFDSNYSINGKNVTGIMSLVHVADSSDCKIYNLDSLNLNTLDGGSAYNYFQDNTFQPSNFTHCNNGNLNALDDIIFTNPNPLVTNINTGENCFTSTIRPLKFDYGCGHSFPVVGLTDIFQVMPTTHIPNVLGTLDFSANSNCDSLVVFTPIGGSPQIINMNH